MSELLFVAVPAGAVAGGTAPLRVLVVPRLSVTTLSRAGLDDWPAALGQAHLEIRLRGAAEPVPHTLRADGRSDVWRAFFASDTPITPWTSQRTYDAPEVTATSQHATGIVDTYRQAARTIADPQVIRERLRGLPWLYEPVAAPPRAPDRPPADGTDDCPPDWTPPDFHRAVAMLREHPAVSRALGLVFELTVSVADLPHRTAREPGAVQVVWPQPAVNARVTSPWTAYEYDGQAFLPASRGDVAAGMLDLAAREPSGVDRWTVQTFDVDGAVGRLRQAAPAILDDATADADLPALRSAGLLLVRHGHAGVLAARTEAGRAAATQAPGAEAPDLTAENLVLGYRVDVRRSGSGTWRPLCARTATYFIAGRPIGPAEDEEGHVKAGAAVRDEPDGPLRADEIVARWSGWSLAVPWRSLGARRRAAPTGCADRLPFDFSWDYTPPKQLPELRFGGAYQLRVRIADVTGGGLLADDPYADRCATDVVAYLRHEPVAAPELPYPPGLVGADDAVDLSPLGPGGDVDRLVIRTEPGDNPANDTRELRPPRTGFTLAEHHGMLQRKDDATATLALRGLAVDDPSLARPELPPLSDPASAGLTVHLLAEPGSELVHPLTDRRDWTGTWPDHVAKHLTLAPGPPGSRPALRWSGDDQVTVSLAPGRQITVELSSHITDLGPFAINSWVDGTAKDAALAGRHPMATPPRRLTLVHAVRRPLGTPAGPLTPVRQEGETAAALSHDSTPLLGVDPPSTVQLEVAAAWDEWDDTPPNPRPRAVSTVVRRLAVDPGDTALAPIRQEFGDTRHRRVTYTLTAVSRFRRYFGENESQDAFRATTTLAPVSVRSTARPAPPHVASVRPALRWSGDEELSPGTTFTRVRQGGLLRVELARPWYTTGEGEQLGVLFWPGGAVPDDALPFVSWAGGDPIRTAADPPAVLSTPGGTTLRHPETGHDLQLVPYAVYEDEDGTWGTWYADIALPDALAGFYRPFVQLAVARYQAESLDGLSLSPVVRAEMVQPLPDRQLTVEQVPGGLAIVLTGPGPSGPRRNRVTAVLETCTPPPGMTAADIELSAVTPTEGVAAWSRVPGAAVSGDLGLALPILPLPTAGPLRLVVREIEQLDTDPIQPTADPVTAELTERTVFLDVVLLRA